MLRILVVSDASGETAERVVRAALAQFGGAAVDVTRCRNVRTSEQIAALVGRAARDGALVVHTLVSNRLRQRMLEQARLHGVDSLDMLGPLLDRLTTHLKVSPHEKPGLFQQLVGSRSREIEAVDFALGHDDGRDPDGLARAEVVLVGVSRTMKSPTMLQLALRGWFAANVPIVPDLDPDPALLALAPDRVFCLELAAERLRDLRRERALVEGIPLEPYASLAGVARELELARQLCRKHRWRRIDVTSKSAEEAAREIIALLHESGESPAVP